MSTSTTVTFPVPHSDFYIVALGASAGGLEALTSFFESMPPDSGLAFVVIQHLAPDFKSQMVELLGRHTWMPVHSIEDGMRVEPNHVYLIPPGKCLKIFHGKLLLSDFTSQEGVHLPIDLFFRSLAEDQGERAIAIGLSGTGSDGTRGIREIKEAGGMVMVQDKESAKFGGLPGNIIATGLADFILPPKEMPAALLKFVNHPFERPSKAVHLHPDETTLHKIAALVRTQCGIDFSAYKQSTVVRRIERRMGVAQIERLEEYLAFLQQSEQATAALAQDLLISVTRFFRDRAAFGVLRDKVIPTLIKNADASRRLRVWVPGCATGEEAYSIAMLFQEELRLRGQSCEVKIFATDVDKRAVDFASAGLYPISIAADVTPDLLARYFVPEDGAYRICRSIRNQVVFARQNLLQDPPFIKVDLISCRNLLIYLQPEWQRKVLGLFYFALRPKGFLFLGSSETIGDRQEAFESVDAKARLFQKRADVSLGIAESVSPPPAAKALEIGKPGKATAAVHDRERSPKGGQDRLWEQLGARLFGEYVPTCLVLNSQHEIVQSYGHPERFVTLQAGQPSLNLLKLVPENLSVALSHSIRRAVKTQEVSVYRNVRFQRGGETMRVDLKVEPLVSGSGETPLLLVYFEELKSEEDAGNAAESEHLDLTSDTARHIADLEADLRETKEELQTAIHEKEIANEELQAANEELLAANEELQSSNEELESVNEELSTLNAEFQQKIAELTLANNDLENFLRTSDLAIIFLDAGLRIRRFTPAVAREINLLPHDVGRPLADLRHPVIDAITDDLAGFAAGKSAPVMKTVETRPDTWHLLKIVPYRRAGATDQGVVVTILDVTQLQRTNG